MAAEPGRCISGEVRADSCGAQSRDDQQRAFSRLRVLRLQGKVWSWAEDAQTALPQVLSWLRESCLTRLVLPAQCAHSALDAFNDSSGGAQEYVALHEGAFCRGNSAFGLDLSR